jgi:osmotically-inducible protein OsmY
MSSDIALQQIVQGRLRATLGLGASRILVSVFNGVAMLSGEVDSGADHELVVQTVRSVRPILQIVDGLRATDSHVQ